MAAAVLSFYSRLEVPLTYGSPLWADHAVDGPWFYVVRIEPVAPGTAVAGKFLVGESRPTTLDVGVLAVNEDDVFRMNVDHANGVTVSLPLYN
jgi:hypothetical protein